MKPFRGLTKDGKMVYGWYQRTDPSTPDKIKHYIIDCCGVTSSALVLAHTLSDLPGYHEVIPETVGQQVGCKDINKNEIYEGDIVKKIQDEDTPDNCKRYDGAIGQVVYSLWPFGEFQIDLIKGEKWSFYYPDSINFIADELEVIGNVHQNPELLEKP